MKKRKKIIVKDKNYFFLDDVLHLVELRSKERKIKKKKNK